MGADFRNAPEQEVTAAVVENWWRLSDERRGKLWLWQECRYAWERKFGETWGEIADNRSHRYIPAPFQVAETMVAQMLQTTMPQSRFFKALGRNKTAQSNSWALEAKLRWDQYRLDFRETVREFAKKAVVDGNVPWTCSWHQETALVPDEAMAQAKMLAQQQGMEVEVADDANLGVLAAPQVTFEGARLHVGDIFNYVQDRHPNDPRFAFRVYRTLRTKEWIKAQWADVKDSNGQPVYKNIDQLENDSASSYDMSDSLKRGVDRAIGYMAIPEDKVELLTFCGDLEIKGLGLFHNCFGVVANRRHLLRFCYNPFAWGLPPWQMFTLVPDPHDPHGYGTGAIEPNLGLFDFVNVRANQVVDANSLAINPPLNVVMDGVTDTRNIIWGPGEVLLSRAQGNIAPVQVSKDALALGMQEIQYYKSEIASTSGTMAGGTSSTRDASATESAGVQKSMGALNSEMVTHFQDDGLVKIVRFQASLNQQLMHPQDTVMVRLFVDEQGMIQNPADGSILPAGVHWAEISFSQIQGEFDYEIVGESAINQTNMQQQAQMNFIQSVSQSPQFAPYINVPALMKAQMEKLGFTDAWKYVKSDQQVQQEMMQAQMMEQQNGPNPAGNPNANPGAPSGPGGAPQNAGGGQGHGLASLPGHAGGGGSPAAPPHPAQLAGPTRMG